MLNSNLDLNFDVLHAATIISHVDGNDIRLVNLRPIALISIYKLTTSSGKHLEDISLAHIVFLLYKPITSAKDTDDLSIGFHRDRGKRQREITKNKNIKRQNHISIYLKHIFGFGEHQEKTAYGLGHKLVLTRKVDNTVLNKANGSIVGKKKLIVLNGMYRIIHHRLLNELFYLSRF